MNLSLRNRLILGIALGLAVLLGLSCVAIDQLLGHAMLATVDESLIGTARLLVPLVEYDDGKVDLDLGKLPEADRSRIQNLVQVWDDGKTVSRSPELDKQDLPKFGGPLTTPESRALVLHNDVPARAVGIVFTVSPSEPDSHAPRMVTLVVARSIVELEAQRMTIRHVLIGAFATIIIASSLIVIVIVTRGLRPLHTLATQIERVDDNNLHHRVDLAYLPAELVPVADRLNQLLARLQAAFDRERGFTADVAHELRTPLAGVHTITDVALSRPHAPEDYRQSLAEVREIGMVMEAMVERLLTLARLDSGQIVASPIEVDLRRAVDAAWLRFSQRAAAKELTFANQVPPDQSVRIDPALLTIILGNLLDNAVEYSSPHGEVKVVGIIGNVGELAIENTGCEFPPQDADKVFRRFWRGDTSRTFEGNHCGLGLALVKRAIAISNGEVRVIVTPDKIFRVALKIPRFDPTTDDRQAIPTSMT